MMKDQEQFFNEIISSSNVEIISFDFFDTLFFRPCFEPADLFYIVGMRGNEVFGLNNFADIRANAENEIITLNSNSGPYRNLHTLEEIYCQIARAHNLDQKKCSELCKFELELEHKTLLPRNDVKRLYEKAILLKKKVIVVSDTYFPKSFLHDLLQKKGFEGVSDIYVSNECDARKDLGDLYVHVLRSEKIDPSRVVHIGDNFHSDVEMAMASGIVGLHYPCVSEYVFAAPDSQWKRALADSKHLDPAARLLLGLAINYWFTNNTAQHGTSLFENDLSLFGFVGLGPLLFYIANELSQSNKIQNNYPNICFASRDGYLPMRSYNLLTTGEDKIPSRYVYCGRAAYDIHRYKGDPAAFLSEKMFRMEGYTLRSLLHYVFEDKNIDIYDAFLKELSEEELNSPYLDNKTAIKRVCVKYDAQLRRFFENEYTLATQYYSDKIDCNSDNRAIIFDVGYGGSVSRAIGALTGKNIDKIYLSENDENKKSDQIYGTTTHVLLKDVEEVLHYVPGIFVFFEELFSPVEAACIGFVDDGGIQPLLKSNEFFSNKMHEDLTKIQCATLDFVKIAKEILGPYAHYLKIKEKQHLLQLMQYAFGQSVECEEKIFSNISFADAYFLNEDRSLSTKIVHYQEFGNLPHPSGFVEPSNIIITDNQPNIKNLKIGIHIYVNSYKFIQQILVPIYNNNNKFDLFITTNDIKVKKLIETFVDSLNLSKMRRVTISFSTGGNSISSWIANTTSHGSDYDLLCHLGAVNPDPHVTMSSAWIQHLIDGSLSPSAFTEIVSCFTNDNKLGLVFPTAYQEAFDAIKMAPGGIIPFEVRKEMDRILAGMKFHTGYKRSDFFFPVGDVFWYRPKAVHPLVFWANEQNELPEKTAAAIKRLLVLVSSVQETFARTFVPSELLLGRFVKQNEEISSLTAQLTHVRDQLNIINSSRSLRVARAGAKIYKKLLPEGTIHRKLTDYSLRKTLSLARQGRGYLNTPKGEITKSISRRICSAITRKRKTFSVKSKISQLNTAKYDRPVFSVVIPIYNRTWQLEVAIESILNQSFKNFELILVCDGSPDDTIEIVDRYSQHPQVRVHKYEDNSGNACRGRNTGIKLARGEYIAFMDSDDISAPNRLKDTLFHFLYNDADMVYGSVEIISDGKRIIEGISDGQFRKSFTLPLQKMTEVNPAWTSTVSVRLDILNRFGAFRNEMRYREDHELWLRLAYNGCKLYAAEEMLAYYRFHENNAELIFKDQDAHWKRLMLDVYQKPYEE
ncbi:glycosyltransferase [Paenochrobactrum glaciei]